MTADAEKLEAMVRALRDAVRPFAPTGHLDIEALVARADALLAPPEPVLTLGDLRPGERFFFDSSPGSHFIRTSGRSWCTSLRDGSTGISDHAAKWEVTRLPPSPAIDAAAIERECDMLERDAKAGLLWGHVNLSKLASKLRAALGGAK